MAARIDPDRGFDHGLFIPLKLMYPEADIPSLQLSLVRGLRPLAHIALGKALRELRQENILVVGSGFSFHNLGAFSWQGTAAPDPENDAFQEWLIEVVHNPDDSDGTRAAPHKLGKSTFCTVLSSARGAFAATARMRWNGGCTRQGNL